MTPAAGSDLLKLARYGERRDARIVSDGPDARLVLFSLQSGQKVSGRGEPTVHLLVLEGEGRLWREDHEVTAQAGTILACQAGQAHGAQAGEGRFLVLGIITPRPSVP